MKRYQFYPSDELGSYLEAEAKERNISVSALLTDIVTKRYEDKLDSSKTEMTFAELCEKVLKEVEDFVTYNGSAKPFDLNIASSTYRSIPMIDVDKKHPKAIRAAIGRKFTSLVGKEGPFKKVKVATSKGRELKSANNALMYVIK